MTLPGSGLKGPSRSLLSSPAADSDAPRQVYTSSATLPLTLIILYCPLSPPHTHTTITTTSFPATMTPLLPLQCLGAVPAPHPSFSSYQKAPGRQPLEFFIFEGHLGPPPAPPKSQANHLLCSQQSKGSRASWAEDGKKNLSKGPCLCRLQLNHPKKSSPDSRHHISGPKALSSFWASPVKTLNRSC